MEEVNIIIDGDNIDVNVTETNESINIDVTDEVINIDVTDAQDGLSAYQIWINEGNTGDEQDFLDSLKSIITKVTTGDPMTSNEGTFCINIFDNTFKVYADGG
jgi:ACT domain-containing protein